MRPRQWIKNIILFAALIFSQNIFVLSYLLQVLLAFGLFCLLSSSVYILNDIFDRESDRRHPQKRDRPIASGRVPILVAVIGFVVLSFGSLVLSYQLLGWKFGTISLVYFISNILYSMVLKRVVIVDVVVLSLFYVIRAIAGVYAIAATTQFSAWLVVCTFFIALFLSLSKRRAEVVLANEGTTGTRSVLKHYSTKLLDQMIAVVTASTVMSYALYSISEQTIQKFGTINLVYTLPFVVFGVFRYLYLVHIKKVGGSPERLVVGDKQLLLNIVLWILTVMFILYDWSEVWDELARLIS